MPTNGPPVLMEMRYSGIFSFGSSGGIYQRLAVGDTACSQAGAALMFAKSPNGTIDPAGVNAVTSAIRAMPPPPPKNTP